MDPLSNAALRSMAFGGLVLVGWAGGVAPAWGNPDLLDIVARIEYGYYTADIPLVSAAHAELERLRGNPVERMYYTGYALWRLNQIDPGASSQVRRERGERCLDVLADLDDDPDWAVEAHVLATGCLLSSRDADGRPGQGVNARLARHIDAAREIDPENPRLLLVAALSLPVDGQEEHTPSKIAALEAALAQFDLQTLEIDLRPAWGRAEVLANLGAVYLERGNSREARDFIERALLEAPGYHFALQLQKALSLH